MTTRQQRSKRGAEHYRVEFRDRLTGRISGYAERNALPHPCGFPSYAVVSARSPMGLWTAKDARTIATSWNKPMGTRPRTFARAVKDDQAAQELPLRNPVSGAA
jgi:hypothetical protein